MKKAQASPASKADLASDARIHHDTVALPESTKLVTWAPRYAITPAGAVLSSCLGGWRAMVPSFSKKYLHVTLATANGPLTVDVHRLVAEAFLGPCPPGLEVAHGDGDHRNNCVGNLSYKTRKDNHADKRRHGTDTAGERHPGAKVGWADVFEIRRRVAAGAIQRRVAADFGLSPPAVCNIVRGRVWKVAANG